MTDPYGEGGWSTIDLALWREYCEAVEQDEAANTPMVTPDTPRVPGAWRDLPPTTKQLKFLSRGWTNTEHKPKTRGEASDLISALKPRTR